MLLRTIQALLLTTATGGVPLACAASTPSSTVAQSATTDMPRSSVHAEAVARLTKTFIDGEWSSGLSIGIVDGGSFETYGFGHRSAKDPLPPNEDTVFEIGSVSKVFTSLLLADAVTRGELALDQPVNTLLRAGNHLPSREGQEITLRHLSTHGSGLPSLPPNLVVSSPENPYVDYTTAALYASLSQAMLATKPGSAYAYSNWGAGILGQVLADHARSTYGELVERRIARPLGLSRTSIRLPAENVAQGHDANGDPASYWDVNGLAGAGAIRSTSRDLIRLVQANLDRSGELGPALGFAQQMQGDYPKMKLGLGWHLLDGLHFHNGQTGGFHSFIAIDIAKKQGVVVLSDTGMLQTDKLGFALVEMLHGEAPSLDLPPLVTVSEQKLDSHVGSYRSKGVGMAVTRDGGRLYVQIEGQPRFRLFPESETTFNLRVVEAKIAFRSGSLLLHQGGEDFVYDRVK